MIEHWDRSDALALVGGIVLLGIAGFVLRELCARQRLLRRLADHAIILLLGGGVASTVFTYPDYKTELFFLGCVAVAVWSWYQPRAALPSRLGRTALVFSPIILIVAWQFLRFPTWDVAVEPPIQKIPARAASPVFYFIFDEWSYTRSTDRGEFLPLFANVRRLAAESTVFEQARSPGPRTDEAIPRLLWSRMDEVEVRAGGTFWRTPGGSVPTASAPSLFTLARERGYNSALFGEYLPFRRMLGAECDQVVSYLEHPKPETFPGKLSGALIRNVAFQHDPVSRRMSKAFEEKISPLSREAYSRHWELINHKLQRDTLATIANCPPNQFAVFHIPLPHCPWIFNPDGTYAGPYKGARMSHDPEGYRKHLTYLDVVIGRFVEAMKRAGKYDNALVIMTSDHSWRLDYTYEGRLRDGEELRHVPLFVKLPGQKQPRRIAERFELNRLREAIDATMRGDSAAAAAALPAQ